MSVVFWISSIVLAAFVVRPLPKRQRRMICGCRQTANFLSEVLTLK